MKTNLFTTIVVWLFYAYSGKNPNRLGLPLMNLYSKKIFIGLSISLLISGQTFAQKDFALNGESGAYYKSGNKISYTWTHFNGNEFSLWLNFYRGWSYMQETYRTKDHSHGNYNRFIQNDPFSQDLIVLARILRKLATENGVSEVDLALSFVQALPYDDDNHHIQRYAIETLIDMRGDCSDTAVLFAGILAVWDYDCIFLNYQSHLAVGVWSSNRDGTYYVHRGRRFYYCETTGWGWEIGKMPDGYYEAKAEDVIF